jgi:uncharacterized protein (TIGR02246 family)
MRGRFVFLALTFFLAATVVHAQSGTSADERSIRQIETRWQTAWNHHDIAAMAALFAPEAGVVNLAGEWFQGREAFARSLESLHSGKVRESIWQTQDIDIKFLTPEIAIVHVHFSSHGDRNPDGSPMPPRRGIFTRVEVKRGGHWVIVASQATMIVPRATAAIPSLTKKYSGQ